MGTSAKKKREKKQDFLKPKLKVGKARPKNTNATDTSFSARSVVFKQQNLSDGGRDPQILFKRNLSLLTGAESQKRDALVGLTTAVTTASRDALPLPQPTPLILSRTQSLLLDSSSAVRTCLLKLLRALPVSELGDLNDFLLWTRAGLTHLSADIRLSSLESLDWLLDAVGAQLFVGPGAWVKTLLTFQNALGWRTGERQPAGGEDKWTAMATGITNATGKAAGGKLLVRQLTVLSKLLAIGLARAELQPLAEGRKAAQIFPLWMTDAYTLPRRARAYGYLNLFGAPRDMESEVYDDAEQRAEVFVDAGMDLAFQLGATEAKREGGEIGRAAAMVEKALRLVDDAY